MLAMRPASPASILRTPSASKTGSYSVVYTGKSHVHRRFSATSGVIVDCAGTDHHAGAGRSGRFADRAHRQVILAVATEATATAAAFVRLLLLLLRTLALAGPTTGLVGNRDVGLTQALLLQHVTQARHVAFESVAHPGVGAD